MIGRLCFGVLLIFITSGITSSVAEKTASRSSKTLSRHHVRYKDIVCAYSHKLRRSLCFRRNQIKGDTCVGKGAGRVCYQLDDLYEIRHSIVCKTKKVSSCRLVISEFCLRNGKCYSNKTGKAELEKRRDRLCARLVVTRAIAGRLSIHCQKHPKDIKCRRKLHINRLRRKAEKSIESKCSIPKNLHQCRVSAMKAKRCRVQVDQCKSLKDVGKQKKCFREIYGGCITKLHFSKHYCQRKSMNPVFSKSCLAVEKREMKCFIMFQHCKSLKSKAERRKCMKDVELKCAYLSMKYVECFYVKHDKRLTGTPQKPLITKDLCGVLNSAVSYCGRSWRRCNRLGGSARRLCFRGITGACIKVAILSTQGKYNCDKSRAGRSRKRVGAGRNSGNNAVCNTLLTGTVNCLDLMNRCRRVRSKRGRAYCAKKSASCGGIIKRYKQNQGKCFG